MSPETKKLTVPPTSGLAPNITPDDLKLPPAVTQRAPSMQPMVQFESQLLAILSDIDATLSPFASTATAAQQPVDASPLTERALCYHRRDAFRTDRNNVAPVPLPSSTDPLDDFGAEMYKKDRLDLTPAPPSESLHSTIQSKIPSLDPDHFRPTSARGQPRMPLEYNTPATFPRVTQGVHMTEQRSRSADLRSLPRAPSLPSPSRAFRSMSSASTTSSAPKTAAMGPRPSAPGTASPRLAAQPGHLQGTSSPVASSTLREISGSGTDRTHGLRTDSPVPPRALLGDPHGPPAHLGCLQQVWDTMGPTLRARIGSIFREDVEAALAHATAAAEVGDPARSAADACAISVTEEELALVMQPLQAKAASLDSVYADLWDRLRHLDIQRRSTAVEMATAERHHQAFASSIRAGSRQPPPPRAATRPAAPATSVPFPTASQSRPTPASAALQHQAPAITAPTAPSAAPTIRSIMPPPPPPAPRVPFTTATPWSVVAARRPRQPPPTPDGYLDLQIDARQHVFPADTRKPIKALTSQVEATLRSLHIDNRTLRLAVQLATQDGSGLCEPLVDDILRLRDLLNRAYATPAGAG